MEVRNLKSSGCKAKLEEIKKTSFQGMDYD
jgi:hypothetical protein